MIYLDTAASYPLLPEVKECLIHAFDNAYANSASSHTLGEQVSKHINEVRELLANEIGAYPSEIIFTSGATESNNIAFKSLLLTEAVKNKKHIVTTQVEHKCIFAITEYLVTLGYEVTYVKPNSDGLITAQSIKETIRPDTALVSVMHVNNELGTVNPIEEIGLLCFENEILFHSDAAQSFQKVEIDVDDLNVDIMSFSAHKVGGPKGIGAIYIRDLRHKQLTPVIHGAGQEEGIRGGTVAAPLILGFGKAIEVFQSYYSDFSANQIKKKFLEKLNFLDIQYIVNGINTLPHCISITFPNVDTETLIRDNENELCLAQGSACSSKEIEPSHVLTSIGLSREMADKTFRISFPLNITLCEIDFLVKELYKHQLV
ncbi:cysteine desulfurase family protein [Pseudoalteromonas sp. L21]|uniref:cysteine desulfurase family protein n=1 Tax=Pseudoalteromonas sp. L21 TaxID=1539746 RepID=UPI001F357E87|nr:cysteine desulfurase family protein [Pseudoalteromonas sp. L21]MCF7519393.1 cysteine desulfurase [Pseudoalteromonas sp. L21]